MKRKPILSRRRQALCRAAVCLAILLFINLFFGSFYILPIQAVRRSEQRNGMFDSEVIHRRWDWRRGEGVYLTINRHAMQATVVDFDLGWRGAGAALDCTTGERMYFGEFDFKNGKQTESLNFFGRLGSWDIKRLEIAVTYSTYLEGKGWQEADTYTLHVNEDDFLDQDGERYFLARHFVPESMEKAIYDVTATAYNARDEVIFQKKDVEAILSTTRLSI